MSWVVGLSLATGIDGMENDSTSDGVAEVDHDEGRRGEFGSARGAGLTAVGASFLLR